MVPVYMDGIGDAHGVPSAARVPAVGTRHAPEHVQGGDAQKARGTPMQLRGWLKATSSDIGASNGRPVEDVEREIGMLKDYDYLQAYMQ